MVTIPDETGVPDFDDHAVSQGHPAVPNLEFVLVKCWTSNLSLLVSLGRVDADVHDFIAAISPGTA